MSLSSSCSSLDSDGDCCASSQVNVHNLVGTVSVKRPNEILIQNPAGTTIVNINLIAKCFLEDEESGKKSSRGDQIKDVLEQVRLSVESKVEASSTTSTTFNSFSSFNPPLSSQRTGDSMEKKSFKPNPIKRSVSEGNIPSNLQHHCRHHRQHHYHQPFTKPKKSARVLRSTFIQVGVAPSLKTADSKGPMQKVFNKKIHHSIFRAIVTFTALSVVLFIIYYMIICSKGDKSLEAWSRV